MSLAKLAPIWREALAVHEAFRRLGFTAEQIYVNRLADDRLAVGLPDVGPGVWWVVLPHDYSLRGVSHSDFANSWRHAVELWNTASGDGEATEDTALYNNSRVRKLVSLFVISILNTGIALPCKADA